MFYQADAAAAQVDTKTLRIPPKRLRLREAILNLFAHPEVKSTLFNCLRVVRSDHANNVKSTIHRECTVYIPATNDRLKLTTRI